MGNIYQNKTVEKDKEMSHVGYNTPLDCTCTDCKLRYPKQYHMHTWQDFRKLDSKKLIHGKEYYRDAQEELCKKYNITLLYYRTKWQRRFDRVEHVINLIIRGSRRFKKALDKLHESNVKRKSVQKRGIFESLTMTERDYKKITGRTTDEDLSFITGRNSKRQNMDFITGKGKRDYSALTGKKKSTPKFDMGKRNYSGLIGSRKKIKL